jgi:hypothetical protein
MKTDQQALDNTSHEREKKAMNSQTFEPRIVAFCCQY